jgi:large subunit ribosomal protein L3
MPGRTGTDRISVKNLEIVKVDAKNKIIAIKGAVPGRKGTLLEIRGE